MLGLQDGFVKQASLADLRLARHDHHAGMAARRPRKRGPQNRQLLVPTDQGGLTNRKKRPLN